jgi:hypothetical protein
MFAKRLNKLREHVEQWCSENSVPAASITDTFGIQGIKIYNRNREALASLLADIQPLLEADQVYCDIHRVRGGLLLAFSVQALTEQQIKQFIDAIGEELQTMNLQDKLDLELRKPVTTNNRPINNIETPLSFDDLALQIVEDQYKDSISGMIRSNQTSRQRNLSTVTSTYGGKVPSRNPKKRKDKSRDLEESKSFDIALLEALQGMATPTDAQPNDLFNKFGQALQQLGKSMGIGPLQDKLKQKGIEYKKSKDGQAIILYIVNATTKAPQPIARISAETLTKPHDFEEQLLHMVDFSKGEAPGAFKQKQEEMRDQEKAARDIAKSLNPEPEGQMQAPPTVEPQAPAPVEAATVAAAPKQPVAKPAQRAQAAPAAQIGANPIR